ncbi:hypothetical protein BpHYR1_029717 [Brachionus plicatilis]|uniref:Uncharacterized protein n=1 Tax=Brachionus plicatilis TaxID=10195 RepID=A0A3M7QKM7_BRAPC|nr:hypothetical protein BpHYR1_029717 [Brachionus plicatilis]
MTKRVVDELAFEYERGRAHRALVNFGGRSVYLCVLKEQIGPIVRFVAHRTRVRGVSQVAVLVLEQQMGLQLEERVGLLGRGGRGGRGGGGRRQGTRAARLPLHVQLELLARRDRQVRLHMRQILVVGRQLLATDYAAVRHSAAGLTGCVRLADIVVALEVLFEMRLVFDWLLTKRTCDLDRQRMSQFVLTELQFVVELTVANVALEVNGGQVDAHVTLQLRLVAERIAAVRTRVLQMTALI